MAAERGLWTSAAGFVVVGVLSVGVDAGALVALHEGADVALGVATTLAFGLSLLVNFTLNKTVVFGAEGRLGGRIARYAVLVVVNYLLTLTLVLAIAAAGVSYLLAKLVAVAICAVVNFVAYRHWVFV